MKLIVISSAPLIEKTDSFYAYSPYVKELNIWAKYAKNIGFCCPISKDDRKLLSSKVTFPFAIIYEVKEFNIKTFSGLLTTLKFSFLNLFTIYKSMLWADHIHIRCPGNIGLMACVVQIFFPNKKKTVKYAGNWDPSAQQPLSYRMQKWILNNSFLTRNIKVLVYGEWTGSSKNIKPFFTATYFEAEKTDVSIRNLDKKIKFIFVGTLSTGKRPLYAIQLIEKLLHENYSVDLDIYGDGNERNILENYVNDKSLRSNVFFHGNQPESIVRNAYNSNHFLILPSKSEGWPKVLAEAMFWGCVPVATAVSCVPFMLDYGNRGVILDLNLDSDFQQIISLLRDPDEYYSKVVNGVKWSRKYTIDLFESEIKDLIL